MKELLIAIRKWFIELRPTQRQFIASQTMAMFPYYRDKLILEEDDAGFVLGMLDNAIDGKWAGSHLQQGTFVLLTGTINLVLYDYPENEDQFFDWFNAREFSEELTKHIREEVFAENPGVDSFAFAFFSSQRHAKLTWDAIFEKHTS
jgi:hypothetical protein